MCECPETQALTSRPWTSPPHRPPLYSTFLHRQRFTPGRIGTFSMNQQVRAWEESGACARPAPAPARAMTSHAARPGRTVGYARQSRHRRTAWSWRSGQAPSARSTTWCGMAHRIGDVDRVGHRGQARGGPAGADRAAGRGARADRGRPRGRQDDAGQGAGQVHRLLGAAHPVHPGPAAQRHHRGQRLQPGAPGVRVQARAGVREHRGRRRDQPGVPEDPVGAAGMHGRAAGHGGRHQPTRWSCRSWSSPPRTRWRWRAPTRCPRRSGTGSPRGSPSATRAPRPSWPCSTRTAPRRRWTR